MIWGNRSPPSYNPKYYQNPSRGRIQPGESGHTYFDDDAESVIDKGEPWHKHLLTWFGAWIIFGAIYWSICFFWGYKYNKNNMQLYHWTLYLSAAAAFSMVIVLGGIMKGIKLGTARAAKWITPYCLVLSLNTWIHVYFARKTNTRLPYSIALISCDFLSMIYVSFVSYGILDKSKKANKCLRFVNFVVEWADLFSQIAVSLVYSRLSSYKNTDIYEDLFWIFILIQLFFWVLPIIWGSGTNKYTLFLQICLLDLFTDFPLLIINFLSGGYNLSYFILFDLFLKILFMVRYVYILIKYFWEFVKEYHCKIFIFCFPFLFNNKCCLEMCGIDYDDDDFE